MIFESRIAESLEQTLRKHVLCIISAVCKCEFECGSFRDSGPEEVRALWRSHLSSIAAKKVVEMAIATIHRHVMPSSAPVGPHLELASEDSLDHMFIEFGGKL